MKEIFTSVVTGLCLVASASPVAVRNYEVADVVATNDMAMGSLYFAPRGVKVEKGGTNALTLSSASVQTRSEIPIAVREGRLRIVDEPSPALEEPVCMQRAALWLDATRPDTLEMADGGEGVSRWYDVRETKGADGA